MRPQWALVSGCALALVVASNHPASAGEVTADPVCCRRPVACCYEPVYTTRCWPRRCYDPCRPVGPVRRCLRKIFLPPCPRPCCPQPVVAVPVPAPVAVVPAPPVFPTPAPPAPAPVMVRPAPVPPAAPPVPPPLPPGESSFRRAPGLTPPTPPPPVRVEHIASTPRGRAVPARLVNNDR
jgi:hypothetical protein